MGRLWGIESPTSKLVLRPFISNARARAHTQTGQIHNAKKKKDERNHSSHWRLRCELWIPFSPHSCELSSELCIEIRGNFMCQKRKRKNWIELIISTISRKASRNITEFAIHCAISQNDYEWKNHTPLLAMIQCVRLECELCGKGMLEVACFLRRDSRFKSESVEAQKVITGHRQNPASHCHRMEIVSETPLLILKGWDHPSTYLLGYEWGFRRLEWIGWPDQGS